MFYLIGGAYYPNTAPTNRVLGYIRALSVMNVDTHVLFFFPDKDHSKVKEKLPHIEFEYLWEKGYIDFPRINKISLLWYMHQFVRRLKANDIIYVYGFPDLVVELSKCHNIRVYAERTEYDEVSFVCHVKKVTIPQFQEACRNINGVIVISQALREYYISIGCKPDKVHVVNMFADSKRFLNIKKEKKEPFIAYCGTATNTKDGVDELIKAFALVVNKHIDYKLYIIGSTPSSKQRFENLELVKKLGIEDKVVFTGVVSSEAMPQMLKNATILALDRPDNLQAKFGFPTKLGEYLLTSNPVVVTSVGDIPLFLKDKESALIARPQDPTEFANKLCWAIENPEDAAIIGCNGKKICEEFFNSLIETKKLIDIVFS